MLSCRVHLRLQNTHKFFWINQCQGLWTGRLTRLHNAVYQGCSLIKISDIYFVIQPANYLFTRQQNFRLVRNESTCRPLNRCDSKVKVCFGQVENISGKGENAGYQHFPLFPKCFRKPPSSWSLKVGIVW